MAPSLACRPGISRLFRMNITHLRQALSREFDTTDAILKAQLDNSITLIPTISSHILRSGGKRLRPLLALLWGRLWKIPEEQSCLFAAIIEIIHTATLLHDDVVDHAELRRGRPTANAHYGNPASVLVGDYLYSRSFQMMLTLDCPEILRLLADATNHIAAGEVLQLTQVDRFDLSEEDYLQRIHLKTATLFAAACEGPALLKRATPQQTKEASLYGFHVGMAFQIIDDVLDFCSSEEKQAKTGDWT